MTRGKFAFAFGVALGYIIGSHSDEITETAKDVKKAWDEVSEPSAVVNTDDLSVEGVNLLLERLRNALTYVGDAPDDQMVIKDDQGEIMLSIGDLRAPFSVFPGEATPQ